MCDLTLYRDQDSDNTLISNIFIDEYLSDANDAQIKVYLYLIRMTNAHMATNISEIADKFNHTEKDVCRALRYWEKKGLLSLDYDQNGGIVGIRLYEVSNPVRRQTPSHVSTNFTQVIPTKQNIVEAQTPISTVGGFAKPQYSLDEIRSFKNREESTQLIFIAERYLGKTLSANDVRSLQFYCDELHFSTELIDFLLQYCIEHDKRSFAYMDKVAITWANNNISTVKEARSYIKKYNVKPSTPKKATTSFHQLEQKEYNFAELEAQLLSKNRK